MTHYTNDKDLDALLPSPIDRRSLLRVAGMGAGIFAVGGGGLLSACARQSRREPAVGGTFSAALAFSFSELDVSKAPTPGNISIADFWAERLYRINRLPPRAGLVPELAVEMPRELSPNRYRIRLRDDATFHNGRPLTADDVVHTLRQFRDPTKAPVFAPFFEIIKDARAVSRHEVELVLTTTTILLAHRLALVWVFSKDISPEEMKLKPVGTGPYRVAAAVSGQKVTLERFEEYPGKQDFNYDKLELQVVTDANARISGLRTGQFKAIEEVPASAYRQLKNAADVDVKSVDSYAMTGLIFNCGKPPFADARVRQAVLYAVDRDAITETSFFGHAEAAWTGVISLNHPEFVKPRTVYRFDPKRAKQLLADAGYADRPVSIDFLISSDVDFIASQGPIFEKNLRDVGFAPNMISGERLSHFARAAEGDFDTLLDVGDNSIFVPDVEFNLQFLTRFVYPIYSHWEGRRLDELRGLLERAAATSNKSTFKRLLEQAQNLNQDESPTNAIHIKKQLTGWSEELRGFRPLPTTGFALDGVNG